MGNRRPSGDGMVRKRDDGRWEGRIVVGHKANGDPIFRHVYAKTQKALTEKLHQSIECYRQSRTPGRACAAGECARHRRFLALHGQGPQARNGLHQPDQRPPL